MNIRRAQVSDADAISRVHINTWRTTYVGIVPEDHLAKLSYERNTAGWRKVLSNAENPAFTFVAQAEGEIVDNG